MGRTEKSQGLAPPAIRKDIRAKQARHIINKVVPTILASNARARRGADSSESIADPGPASSFLAAKTDSKDGGDDVAYVKRKGQGRRKAKGDETEGEPKPVRSKKSGKRRNDSVDEDMPSLKLDAQPGPPPPLKKDRSIKIVTTDSLTAAQILASSSGKQSKKAPNVCILNMASPLRPGGGVLAGATSQEEFLCARTTLLPSLKDEFYRLPEFGGIYTPDTLVLRSPGPLGDTAGDLVLSERYYIDVISAGMLRFPDLEGSDEEVKTLSKRDRDVVEKKMRAVLRIAEVKGVRKLVLGAWGCGAYGNPVADIAQAWSCVLGGKPAAGSRKSRVESSETWPTIEDFIFAIPNVRMAKEFAKAFGSGVEVEDGPRGFDDDDEEDEDDKAMQELQGKIKEMEGQISKVWNPDLKSRLGVVLDGLKAQLNDRQNKDVDGDEDDIGPGEDGVGSDEGDELEDAASDNVEEEEDDDDDDDDDEEEESSFGDVDNGVAVKS